MSYEVEPTLSPNERTGALLMSLALFAGLLLFGAWYDAACERGARSVQPIHAQKGNR